LILFSVLFRSQNELNFRSHAHIFPLVIIVFVQIKKLSGKSSWNSTKNFSSLAVCPMKPSQSMWTLHCEVCRKHTRSQSYSLLYQCLRICRPTTIIIARTRKHNFHAWNGTLLIKTHSRKKIIMKKLDFLLLWLFTLIEAFITSK